MRDAVNEVLFSRFVGQGPKVDEFERAFKDKFQCGYPISVNSGTSALETAYDIIGIKPGDEVISSPLTCSATNLPLLHRGAKVVWADIDRKTLCIDPYDAWKKITEKTKAIVQVHLGGITAKMDEFNDTELTNRLTGRRIPIVSDACQALGTFTGDYTCNSFQAIKHITTADGGMVTFNNEEESKRAKRMRWFGIDREKKIANNWQACKGRLITCDIVEPGFKRQMNDVSAALGIVGLKYYDDVIEHRKNIFTIYRNELCNVPGLKLVDGPDHKFWLATIIVEDRDKLMQKLFEADIDCNVVQTRNDILTCFGGKRADLPVMNELEFKYMSIPIGMRVNEDDALNITRCIREGW